MSIIELKNKFLKRKITKANYIKKIYIKYHDLLFQYSDIITKTDIEKIEITNSNVKITSKRFKIDMVLPKFDHRSAPLECLNFNNYEETELDVIMQLLPIRGNFIDIGANIGWHSLIIAKNFKQVKVYAFEPIKKTYEFLRQNIKLNTIKNIKTFNFGFFNKNKKISFYTYKEGSGNSSIRNLSNRKSVIRQIANVKILDHFVKKEKLKVDFIKCDVEGAELFVFLGAKKTLYKYKPIVFCEMLRKWSKKFKYHPNEIIQFFSKIGYECFKISKHVDKKKFILKKVTKISSVTRETNFLFIHRTKHVKIIKKYV